MDKNNKTRFRIIFTINGIDIYPEFISDHLSLKPTASYKKGDLVQFKGLNINKSRKVHRKENGWVYDFGFLETYFMDEISKLFLEVFNPKKELLNGLKNLYEVEMYLNVIVEISGDTAPSIFINHELIEFLNITGIEIDFDLYIL